MFERYLKKQGVRVIGAATTVRKIRAEGGAVPTEGQSLHTHESKRLRELLRRMNHKSVNLLAEAILRRAGGGSTKGGWKPRKRYFKSIRFLPVALSCMTARACRAAIWTHLIKWSIS